MSKITEMKIRLGRTAQIAGDYIKIELEGTLVGETVSEEEVEVVKDNMTKTIDNYILGRERDLEAEAEKSAGWND